MYKLQQQSYFLKHNQETLHLKRIFQNPNGITVFLMHGSVEDGRIYYSKSGKGLAPFLAQQGYDVFEIDNNHKGICLQLEMVENTTVNVIKISAVCLLYLLIRFLK